MLFVEENNIKINENIVPKSIPPRPAAIEPAIIDNQSFPVTGKPLSIARNRKTIAVMKTMVTYVDFIPGRMAILKRIKSLRLISVFTFILFYT